MNQPPPASNDSEEAANIGAASDDSTRIEEGDERFTASGKQRENLAMMETTNGHDDPKQRRIYLGLLLFSLISSTGGLALIVIWMFNYRKVTGIGLSDANQLANLHPIMMYTFMVSLNAYAVLVYRTHYSQPKDRLKWTHAILSGVNIVMSLLGVLAMLKSHLMAGYANFYSIHSWIGVLTNAFYLSQFILGFVAFLKPGLAHHHRAILMPWHRLCGATVLVLAALAAITGISELVIFQDSKAYTSFAPLTFIANFAAVAVIITTGITMYLLTAPQYLRKNLAEETPLKR